MLRIIIANSTDYTFSASAYVVDCDEHLDIVSAVKNAAQEYFHTKDGANRHDEIIDEDENWSWDEALYEIPRDILKKHGITIPELGECVFAQDDDDMTGDEDDENWTCSCGNVTDCVMSVDEWIEQEDELTAKEIKKLRQHSSEMDSDFCEDCWNKYKTKILED